MKIKTKYSIGQRIRLTGAVFREGSEGEIVGIEPIYTIRRDGDVARTVQLCEGDIAPVRNEFRPGDRCVLTFNTAGAKRGVYRVGMVSNNRSGVPVVVLETCAGVLVGAVPRRYVREFRIGDHSADAMVC